jgi:hypothetical protein
MGTKTATETATCQVCGRAIKANTGLIAHHGYRRPYAGWQTASCEGARYVPYEVSCDRLREVTEMVRNFIVSQEEALTVFLATPPQTITVFERRSSWDRKGTEVEYTKPDDFKQDSYRSRIPHTYECAYADRKYDYERTIRAAKVDLSIMERRLNEWKPAFQVVQQEPECPEGYFWNGRQCFRETPWPVLSTYEREGF